MSDDNGSTPGVYAKLNEVMGKVGRIPKTGRNDFHGYDYATEADIVDEIRPLMSEAGLVFIPSQGAERKEVTVQTKGGETTVVKILHTFRFVDTEDGSEVEVSVWGEGQDSMDKGSYKAFTGAEKYALMKTFMVATGDDPERDASRPSGRRTSESNDKGRPNRTTDSNSGLDCPDCGGPVWDNRDDDKAAMNGGKRPNFKCKDRDGCNWASWDSEEEVWGADVPDEIDAALNELSGLNADRAAEARAWVEGLARDLYDDPEKTDSVLSTVEQAIEEERANGGAPNSEESEAEGAPSDVPGEPAAKAEVRTRLKQEVGEAWKGQLSEFGFQMEGFSANTDEWSEAMWSEVLEGLERHGMAYIQAPDEVLSGEQEQVGA